MFDLKKAPGSIPASPGRARKDPIWNPAEPLPASTSNPELKPHHRFCLNSVLMGLRVQSWNFPWTAGPVHAVLMRRCCPGCPCQLCACRADAVNSVSPVKPAKGAPCWPYASWDQLVQERFWAVQGRMGGRFWAGGGLAGTHAGPGSVPIPRPHCVASSPLRQHKSKERIGVAQDPLMSCDPQFENHWSRLCLACTDSQWVSYKQHHCLLD